MPGRKVRIFKRGIGNERIFKQSKIFFDSQLGRKIVHGKLGRANPFQVCIRDNYFNVYWNGCSVMKFRPGAREKTYTIHHKYVHGKDGDNAYLPLDPKREMMVNDLTTETLPGWSFDKEIVTPAIDGVEVKILNAYVGGTDGDNLKEKTLLKLYLESSQKSFLIDLEVAFSRLNSNNKPVADRIDMAEIQYNENDLPVLKLVEVKASNDSRLRAIDEKVLLESPKKIMYQMRLYQEFLNREMSAITESYRRIASNMLDLGFGASMPKLGHRSANDVLEDFSLRGTVDPKPHLLVLYSNVDKYVQDKHFYKLKDVIAEKYPPLRCLCVND